MPPMGLAQIARCTWGEALAAPVFAVYWHVLHLLTDMSVILYNNPLLTASCVLGCAQAWLQPSQHKHRRWQPSQHKRHRRWQGTQQERCD